MEKNNANAVCPFWRWEDSKTLKVCCEGGEGVDSHTLKFRTKAKMLLYKAVHCEGDPRRCPYYRLIQEKYRER